MDNRKAILDAALDLFSRRGYDAVGVQEICEASGITKPTLYHYFGSKIGLFRVLLSERFDSFLERLELLAAYGGDLPRTLDRTAEAFFAFADANPGPCRLLLAAWFSPPEGESFEAAAELTERQQGILERLFLDASRDHGNMKGRERRYSLSFLGLLNTYAGASLAGALRLTPELAREAVRQFSIGIYS